MKFTKPIPFEEAIARLGQKTVVASGLDSHDWAFRVPVALRERAFFSSQVESAQFLQRTKDALDGFIQGHVETITRPDGTPTTALKTGGRAAFIRQAREFAKAEGLGPIGPGGRGGLKDITSRKRLGLIFDVQTQSAHDFGFWRQGNDPRLLDEFPAQRFVREAAVKKKRALHEQNEGVVRLKNDLDFWVSMNSVSIGGFGVPYGPWGFNSGMGVEDVDRDEAERLGLLAAGEKVDSPEADWNDRLRASTRNLDPDVQTFLGDAFGNQVEFVGGTVRWRNDAAQIDQPQVAPSRPDASPIPQQSPRAEQVQAPRRSSGPAVSRAFDLPSRGRVRAHAEHALRAIDAVHSDGSLDPVPIQPLTAGQSLGVTVRSWRGGIERIGVRVKGPWPELTTVHEIGHVLDWAVLGGGKSFGSEAASLMAGVMEAIGRSKAVARLRLMAAESSQGMADHIANYLLSKRELWARAYAQYIAEKSADPTLTRQLATRLSKWGPQQWDEEDFAPIRDAIDEVFQTLRWL